MLDDRLKLAYYKRLRLAYKYISIYDARTRRVARALTKPELDRAIDLSHRFNKRLVHIIAIGLLFSWAVEMDW